MSIQPLVYDPDFGYVIAIEPGQHFEWGQEICVEFMDGRSLMLGPADIGCPLWLKVTAFLDRQKAAS